MWNDYAVFGGRMELYLYCSTMWKSLVSESAMMFLVPLKCWQYMYTLLLTSVQPSQITTVSWTYYFTGSNDALYIPSMSLEISVMSRMWNPCPIFWIVMQIDTDESIYFSRFNVSTPCHQGWMYQHRAIPLSLCPTVPYLQALDHIMNVGFVKTMLFTSTTFSVTHWRIFIQRCRSCLCLEWRCCGTNLYNPFRKGCSQLRKYLDGVMMCSA